MIKNKKISVAKLLSPQIRAVRREAAEGRNA
jgi:hypothetical protein